ncbi:hypothetical protein F751_1373 [Auxenochlorella protothecoides]|uniref:Mediator of RNA polymerase II transcription subunit 13 n=1 Tax=Auxenochlorella protothecoides TaxID=3075 RepID=A0A087SEF4_AUXPR|nr:hypothetical protein F751_1373 [Auxenochlorella protothecoides]KFM24108.1 hypothetical protein F751_1373 [Auxenochlorella protothecoides]
MAAPGHSHALQSPVELTEGGVEAPSQPGSLLDFELATPPLRVGYQGDWLDVSPAMLATWDISPLEPMGEPKHLHAYALCQTGCKEATHAFCKDVGAWYGMCGLGEMRCPPDSVQTWWGSEATGEEEGGGSFAAALADTVDRMVADAAQLPRLGPSDALSTPLLPSAVLFLVCPQGPAPARLLQAATEAWAAAALAGGLAGRGERPQESWLTGPATPPCVDAQAPPYGAAGSELYSGRGVPDPGLGNDESAVLDLGPCGARQAAFLAFAASSNVPTEGAGPGPQDPGALAGLTSALHCVHVAVAPMRPGLAALTRASPGGCAEAVVVQAAAGAALAAEVLGACRRLGWWAGPDARRRLVVSRPGPVSGVEAGGWQAALMESGAQGSCCVVELQVQGASSAREVAAAGSWVARREAQAGPVLLCPLGAGCTLRVRPVVGTDSPDEASLREMVSDLQALAVLGAATAQLTNSPGGGDAHRPWPAHAQGCLHAATLLLALTRASGRTGAVM